MKRSEYTLMSEIQDKHWLWLGRQKIIESIFDKFLPNNKRLYIADFGCGTGANIPMLRKYGNVYCTDIDMPSLEQIKEKWDDDVEVEIWDPNKKIDKKFDLIVLTDVLEHIPDDAEVVSWISEHLVDGGHALLTVPAHKYLWSQLDDAVHHVRRYEKKKFIELFNGKLKIVKFSFYNVFLFPVKAIFVLISRPLQIIGLINKEKSYLDLPPKFFNVIFKYLLYIEAKMISFFSLPNGVSMVILLKK